MHALRLPIIALEKLAKAYGYLLEDSEVVLGRLVEFTHIVVLQPVVDVEIDHNQSDAEKQKRKLDLEI